MNDDIELDDFIADQIAALARFRDVVRAGWVSNKPARGEEWQGRMHAMRGTVYPGEAPIQSWSEWAEENPVEAGERAEYIAKMSRLPPREPSTRDDDEVYTCEACSQALASDFVEDEDGVKLCFGCAKGMTVVESAEG